MKSSNNYALVPEPLPAVNLTRNSLSMIAKDKDRFGAAKSRFNRSRGNSYLSGANSTTHSRGLNPRKSLDFGQNGHSGIYSTTQRLFLQNKETIESTITRKMKQKYIDNNAAFWTFLDKEKTGSMNLALNLNSPEPPVKSRALSISIGGGKSLNG